MVYIAKIHNTKTDIEEYINKKFILDCIQIFVSTNVLVLDLVDEFSCPTVFDM